MTLCIVLTIGALAVLITHAIRDLRVDREWIRRLHSLQQGRDQQRQDYERNSHR